MRRIFTRLSNRHENVFKYVIILIAVLSIVIALPKGTSFNYNFEAGKPWGYDNLIAPFSFPIAKSEAELNEEKAAVLKNVHPYYRYDDQLIHQKEKQLELEILGADLETTSGKSKKEKKL